MGQTISYQYNIDNKLKLKEVIPIAPYMEDNVKCDEESILIIPEQEGVIYTYYRDKDYYIVTATAEEGYILVDRLTAGKVYYTKNSVQFSWKLKVRINTCPPVNPPINPPTKPTINPTHQIPNTGSQFIIISFSLFIITGLSVLAYPRLMKSTRL